MVNITDGKSAEAWFHTQPGEVCVLLATRAVLRVLPVLVDDKDHSDFQAAILLPCWRGIALPWVASTWLIQGERFAQAAGAAAHATYAATHVASLATPATASLTRAATHAASNAEMATNNASRAAIHVANIATLATTNATRAATHGTNQAKRATMWNAISSDATPIEEGSGRSDVSQSQLWPTGKMPGVFARQWDALKAHLHDSDQEDGPWWVWTDWYERRLAGEDTPNEELELARVLEPTEDQWKAGPAVINPLLAEIEQRFRGPRINGVHVGLEPEGEKEKPEEPVAEVEGVAAPDAAEGEETSAQTSGDEAQDDALPPEEDKDEPEEQEATTNPADTPQADQPVQRPAAHQFDATADRIIARPWPSDRPDDAFSADLHEDVREKCAEVLAGCAERSNSRTEADARKTLVKLQAALGVDLSAVREGKALGVLRSLELLVLDARSPRGAAETPDGLARNLEDVAGGLRDLLGQFPNMHKALAQGLALSLRGEDVDRALAHHSALREAVENSPVVDQSARDAIGEYDDAIAQTQRVAQTSDDVDVRADAIEKTRELASMQLVQNQNFVARLGQFAKTVWRGTRPVLAQSGTEMKAAVPRAVGKLTEGVVIAGVCGLVVAGYGWAAGVAVFVAANRSVRDRIQAVKEAIEPAAGERVGSSGAGTDGGADHTGEEGSDPPA